MLTEKFRERLRDWHWMRTKEILIVPVVSLTLTSLVRSAATQTKGWA